MQHKALQFLWIMTDNGFINYVALVLVLFKSMHTLLWYSRSLFAWLSVIPKRKKKYVNLTGVYVHCFFYPSDFSSRDRRLFEATYIIYSMQIKIYVGWVGGPTIFTWNPFHRLSSYKIIRMVHSEFVNIFNLFLRNLILQLLTVLFFI